MIGGLRQWSKANLIHHLENTATSSRLKKDWGANGMYWTVIATRAFSLRQTFLKQATSTSATASKPTSRSNQKSPA